MKDMAAVHEQEIRVLREEYEKELKDIESEITAQSHTTLIADLESKCMKFIEEIKKYEIREEELENVKGELEREKGVASASLEKLQKEHREQTD